MFFLRSGITFVRFLIIFMAGIAMGISTSLSIPLWMLFAGGGLYLFLYYLEKKYKVTFDLKSWVAWGVLFLFGILLVEVKTESNQKDHFIHVLDSIRFYQARVSGSPEYAEKSAKIILEVCKLKTGSSEWLPSSGKIIGYIPKESSLKIGKGDILLIHGKPSLPPAPANPGQFDYAGYLHRQNIYAVHFLRQNNFRKIAYSEDFWLIRLADGFRNFCEQKLRAGIKNDNEYYLSVALLLGVKTGLDEKLYQAYSETGTVHALAVSGLHVSLIYFIVIFVFGFLKKLKHGKFLFAAISIMIFWFYALVTGFSPSVVRAVTMFSVFLIAGILKRNSGIYNTLAFSAFVILCVEPFWLMDIGFQFSFLAVVGIAYLYPVLYEWLPFKIYLADKLWSLVCLSLAAQLAVSPLSIYYFHSFPLLFLPFNMLIVPLSSLALYTGLIGLIVYKIGFLSEWCMTLTAYIVRLMNYLVQLPSGSEFLKVDFIYWTKREVILLYLFIVFFFFSFKNKVYKSFVWSLGWIFLFSFSLLYNGISGFQKEIFTVYNVKGKTVVSFIHGGHAIVLSDHVLTTGDKNFRFNVYNHLARERIRSFSFHSFEEDSFPMKKDCTYGQLLVWKGRTILRIHKDSSKELPEAILSRMDYLIVSNESFCRKLQKLENKVAVKKVIVDVSVKEKYFQKTENLYYVSREGAFVCEE